MHWEVCGSGILLTSTGYRDCIGSLERSYWGCIGIVEEKMTKPTTNLKPYIIGPCRIASLNDRDPAGLSNPEA